MLDSALITISLIAHKFWYDNTKTCSWEDEAFEDANRQFTDRLSFCFFLDITESLQILEEIQ